MRIGVLTFHRCINYGSYWQACCLVEGLRARGHDAVLLDHDAPDVRYAEWRCAFQPLLPCRTPRSDYRRYAAKVRRFLAAFAHLPQSARFPLDRPDAAGSYDLVLVGSDEVWNFRHPWYGSQPIFFGEGLRAERVASYAASFGNHDADDGIHPEWAERLERFSDLSVRDDNSRVLVRNGAGREAALVLDPCLQFALPAYAGEGDYVALYGHSFPGWFSHHVREFASRLGKRIVSIGYRNDWADEQRIEAGPEDFPALIAGAGAVATNFFHGCVFALHYRRPFAAVASSYRQNKLRDLTRLLGVGDHLIDERSDATQVADLLEAPLAPAIAARIEGMREQSDRYLAHVLG